MTLPGNGVRPVPSGIPGGRVVDDLQRSVAVERLAEIPRRAARRVARRRNTVERLLILALPRAEEEQLVLHDRSAKRRARDVRV